jgi:hypothetical protein
VTGFGLDDGEARAVAHRFGVAIEQVRRDHLISHILAALSASHGEQVIFFGGTALARTHRQRIPEPVEWRDPGVQGDGAARAVDSHSPPEGDSTRRWRLPARRCAGRAEVG